MGLKEWCSWNYILFNSDDSLRLTQGRWTKDGEKVSIAYIGFKLVISAYLIAAYVLSHLHFYWKPDFLCNKENDLDLEDEDSNTSKETEHLCNLESTWPYYWLYFTSWSFNLFVLSIFVDTILVLYRYLNENKKDDKSNILEEFTIRKIYLQISWVLSTMAYPIAFTITVIYWSALYRGGHTAFQFYLQFNVHAVQSLIAFFDIIVSSRPWKPLHFYCPLTFAITYAIFQVIYVVAIGGLDEKGHDYIYSILKWQTDPTKAVGLTFGICVLGILAHLGICLLAYGLDLLWKKLNKKN